MGQRPTATIFYGFEIDYVDFDNLPFDDYHDLGDAFAREYESAHGLPRPEGAWPEGHWAARSKLMVNCPTVRNWGGEGDEQLVVGLQIVCADWDAAEVLDTHDLEGAAERLDPVWLDKLCGMLGVVPQGCDLLLLTEFG
jgi:hypothetical protein